MALRIVPAIILLQTLWFKFSGHPVSVALFSQLGVDPYGRVGVGILELIIAVMLLVPKTSLMGALATVILMIGAILTHLFMIGLEFRNDGGSLFTMAVITFACSALFLFLNRRKLFL